MCWNADVSISTFLLGFLTILYKGFNGYPLVELGFYFTVILIQLYEYFIWTYYNNPVINTIATICLMITIALQPIISSLLLSDKNYNLMLISIFIYICIILLTNKNIKLLKDNISDINSLTKEFYSYRGKDGHLVWNWTKNNNNFTFIIYLIFLIIPIYIYGLYDLLIIGGIFLAITVYKYNKYDTLGSMWCWFVNLWSIYLIMK